MAPLAQDHPAEDLISLLYGNITWGASNLGSAGTRVPGSAGETTRVLEEKYGIPSMIMADGPAGIRLRQSYQVERKTGEIYGIGVLGALENGFLEPEKHHENADVYYQYCTAFPVGTALAQTWDLELMIVGHKDGGGTVSGADDAYRGGVGDGEDIAEEKHAHGDGEEDTELGGSAEEQHLGVGQQRSEIDHGADTNKQQQGQQLIGHGGAEQHIQHTVFRAGLIDLSDRAGEGQVDQNGAEAHGQQQSGFHVKADGQEDQQAADDPHYQHTRLKGQDVFVQNFHRSCSFLSARRANTCRPLTRWGTCGEEHI